MYSTKLLECNEKSTELAAELLQQGRFIALLVSPDSAQLAKLFRQEAGM